METISNKQIADIEKAIILSEQDRKSMKEDMQELKEWYKLMSWKLDQFIEKLDNRYAKKASVDKLWTIVRSVIGFFFVWAGGAILSLIFIQH